MGLKKQLLFDKGDYELLNFLNSLIEKNKSRKYLKRLFDPYLHPHGIKELASAREDRIAYAMMNLLGSLEAGKASDRIDTIRSLQAEIMSGNKSSFRLNTARVLLQIMKDIVRCHGDRDRQIELIHEFRTALTGKPRVIRAGLRKYHLLELSEEWNQVAFDDHVHDANTKGRKTPSHLIMDAWIKGIRSLKIIYYNHIKPAAARELLEAADIMGVTVRISVEFPAKFAKRHVQLIWAPRGFFDSEDFLDFLNRKPVRKFMEAGIELSEHQRQFTFAVLEDFNQHHLRKINKKYSVSLAPLTREELKKFAGAGEVSLVHVAELINSKITAELASENAAPTSTEIFDEYLTQNSHPDLVYPDNFPGGGKPPELLTLTPRALVERLSSIITSYRLTLNLSGLTVADVLDLLCETSGKITHLEIFNLKDFLNGAETDRTEIEELRNALNEHSVIKLKRLILALIDQARNQKGSERKEQVARLTAHLDNITELLGYYAQTPLRVQIGSDSTGRAWNLVGMGFAALDTLPLATQREAAQANREKHILIPHTIAVLPRQTYVPKKGHGILLDKLFKKIRHVPLINVFGYTAKLAWVKEEHPDVPTQPSPIVTLSGVGAEQNKTDEIEEQSTSSHIIRYWKNMNTGTLNILKIIIGFIPAFLTFYLTKHDWWVLQYGGALIWFAITGFRNIIQSILGGRGFRDSTLLSWNDFVSWSRVADSLLFTGFSVPLLDYLVKTLLLSHGLNVTTTTNPIALYTIMALANGIYIFTHNVFRGLPRGAAIGNIFRSILSIPVAILFNGIIGGTLRAYGVVGVDATLQKWAAVISKSASDCVAGMIEGSADRVKNMKVRREDYNFKIRQIFTIFAKLELLFPRKDVSQMLENQQALEETLLNIPNEMKEIMIVNALDMLYFWMYQPRARDAFKEIITSLTPEERKILLLSQNILKCEKTISEMFVNGLLGKKFATPLAFYLESSTRYISNLTEFAELTQSDYTSNG